jgi:hypothetical protein
MVAKTCNPSYLGGREQEDPISTNNQDVVAHDCYLSYTEALGKNMIPFLKSK